MSKKDVFKNIVRYEVNSALREVYNVYNLTPNQEKLADTISEKLYLLLGDSVTLKELQEKKCLNS